MTRRKYKWSIDFVEKTVSGLTASNIRLSKFVDETLMPFVVEHRIKMTHEYILLNDAEATHLLLVFPPEFSLELIDEKA